METKYKHPKIKNFLGSTAYKRLWIVSGGQSGVDRAAMEFALQYRLPVRGWCPKGRLAEDGTISAQIPVQETDDEDPALRTEMNVFDSDGTVILSFAEVRDGTVLTEECANNFNKPCLWFDIGNDPSPSDRDKFRDWIEKCQIRILNVAGPRESFRPGAVYSSAMVWLQKLLLA